LRLEEENEMLRKWQVSFCFVWRSTLITLFC